MTNTMCTCSMGCSESPYREASQGDLSKCKCWCHEKTSSLSHVAVTVPRTIKGDGCDYTYYQQVCSCGWRGEWRANKVTAQMDQCENRHFGR